MSETQKSVTWLDLRETRPFEEILREHAIRYPAMTPCDAVKLIYQATFGVGHLLTDEAAVRERIAKEEKNAVSFPASPAVEDIGGGFARLCLNRGIPSAWTARLFQDAGQNVCGTEETFTERLAILRALTREGVFAFDAAALEDFLTGYLADGLRAVSHSEIYRNTYHPAYRVVSRDMAVLLPLLLEISRKVEERGFAVLAIDGFCASGKSTLAGRLSNLFGARRIPMDDFFLPPSKRTPKRLSEPGGNVDYERFREEVLTHLSDETLTYGVFDCGQMAVTHNAVLPKTPVTIIEGAYALHPFFGTYADIRVFMETDDAEQKRRILVRNGAAMLARFEERWIPMEHTYVQAFSIREKCMYGIRT
ncbi:MAG: uridine kinase [Eubacteriales bacterium]